MRGTEYHPVGFYKSRRGSIFGVLKGISDYFGIRVLWVRMGAVAALFMTGFFPVVFLYILMALVMKREPSEGFRRYQKDKGYQGKLYRSRDGMVMGLLKGISDRLDLSLFWLRVITIIASMFTGFIPGLVIYVVTSLLVSKEPVMPIQSMAEEEFYDSYTHSREGAIHRIKRRFDKLESRIRRMESSVTDREFDWGHKLKSNHS